MRMAALDGNDLRAIRGPIEVTVDEKPKKKLNCLPTIDDVMGELKAIREEQPLQSHKLSEHEDRIEKNRRPSGHIFN
jgi:hypothetical protein